MSKDEYRIKQGALRRASDEIGVRSALISVHRLIEERLGNRRSGGTLRQSDQPDHDSRRAVLEEDARRFDERAERARSERSEISSQHGVLFHPAETRRRRWDRIALALLLLATIAFAAALWFRMGGMRILAE